MKKISPKNFLILFSCLFLLNITNVYASSSEWVQSGALKARLITATDSIDKNYDFDAAIELKLDSGWHTYWKVSGDAGLPPRFDWASSKNVKAVDISWPTPKRFKEAEFTTFGYSGNVVFPIKINLTAPEIETILTTKAQILICNDVCIPQQIELALTLPSGNGNRSDEYKIIETAREKIPTLRNKPNLKIDTIVAGPDALVVKAYDRHEFENIDVFATSDKIALTTPIEIEKSKDDDREALIRIPAPADISNLSAFLKGQKMDVVLVSGSDAVKHSAQF